MALLSSTGGSVTPVASDLALDVGDRLLGRVHAAVHDLPARALRKVPSHEQDHQAEHRTDEEGQPPAEAEVDDFEEYERAEGAENRTAPVGSVDCDVDSAAESGGDELVDRRVDCGIFAADTHACDEPGDVEEDDPAAAVAKRQCREAAAEEVDAQGDHEEVASTEFVGQPPEEQRADYLAGQVHGGDQPDGRRRQPERLGLGERVGHRAGHGDLQTIEDPGHAESDDHAGVERRPRQPVDPCRNDAADDAGCLGWRCHGRLLASRTINGQGFPAALRSQTYGIRRPVVTTATWVTELATAIFCMVSTIE